MITPTREDYVREIYVMQEKHPGEVRLIELADRLSLSKSTVTERIADLAEGGFVVHNPYRGVGLTGKGRKLGERLTYRHRIIEAFLATILGMRGRIVHEEAHKLEHVCSDELIEAMRALIPNKTHCPDGSPIPMLGSGVAA